MYDVDTSQLTNLKTDEFFRMWPKIHGRRIVYMDLRFGDNNPMGNWNHSAVFLHDLDTEETTQIAGGDWIAFDNVGTRGDSLIVCDLLEGGFMDASGHVCPKSGCPAPDQDTDAGPDGGK